MTNFTSEEAQQLFHNKFVVVLGDSIQRSVYKDLVVLLQKDDFLTTSQLKAKGEYSFAHDFLVEGGQFEELNNGTKYREVRQYRTDHHLVRFYFLTRVYSDYLESILADFKAGPQPDVVIINSCVWDVSRYGKLSMEEYKQNLGKLFSRLDEVILPECLLIWNMTLPLAQKITGGFLLSELQHLDKTLRHDIIEANFYSAILASCHKFDVLDLHYHFRFDVQNRLKDGVHWNQIVHRKITQLLLAHIADAWGVKVPEKRPVTGPVHDENSEYCAPRRYNSMPSFQVGYRPRFLPSGPPASYKCGVPSSFRSHWGADIPPQNASTFANNFTFPMQKFSKIPMPMAGFPPHPPACQWNGGSSSHGLVMRRPLQQRDGGAPHCRQQAVPYGRY
ncbi:PC-esterase domain-containing protein 1A-like isoform X2 [Rhinatrema bivittatum]|uniref:PC-esterase domain-containing protein 1A-like isoform X2 n=1 Tax=Rhinatrema bivittatum TaxID=194408 RepID=UPI0011279912|nr:PC-esterase domain-containing protein 1A-like isoform X2 [Rhinatrema bivittatum]